MCGLRGAWRLVLPDAEPLREGAGTAEAVMGRAVGVPGRSRQPTTVPHAGSGTLARLLTP